MRIAELYAQGRVFSLEFYTPKTPAGHRSLWRTLADLKRIDPGYVSVTCGAAGTTREPTAELVIKIQREFGIPAMAHLVCTGTTQAELEETLSHLEAEGIENVLTLRGDPPRDQPDWQPVAGGFAHANELAAFVREHFHFSLGGACYPETHHEAVSPEADLEHCLRKVEAGVEFLITQLFFDNERYWEFVARAREAGIDVPIVPGIMPMRSRANLERILQLSPGTSVPERFLAALAEAGEDEESALAVGVDWAVRQCRELLEGGAPGIHYYTMNLSVPVRRVHERVMAP